MLLVQLLTKKSEFYQQLLMVLLFWGFIVYSVYTELNISFYGMLGGLILIGIFSVYLIRFQLKNRVGVRPQLIWDLNNNRIQKNILWLGIPFFVVTLLTIFHFYIVYSRGNNLAPLFWDYGIGGVLGLALYIFQLKTRMIGICDEGIITGYKLELKLITWNHIQEAVVKDDTLIITFNQFFPISMITIHINDEFGKNLKTLLEYKIGNIS